LQTLNRGETQQNTQTNMSVTGCANSKTDSSKQKRSVRVSVPKEKGTIIRPSSISGGTFKEQVDLYFINKHDQLESTTAKIIKKYNRKLEANNVISSTYLFVIGKEPEILHFARTFSKSLQHVIYSFTLKYINQQIAFPDTTLNREVNKFLNTNINIDDEQTCIQKYTSYQSNIYNEDFIERFYQSLNKIDRISFYAFYFEGVDNAKDFAKRFNISTSSAYTTINELKRLLKLFIAKHKIE